jgi:hypothetical protein
MNLTSIIVFGGIIYIKHNCVSFIYTAAKTALIVMLILIKYACCKNEAKYSLFMTH